MLAWWNAVEEPPPGKPKKGAAPPERKSRKTLKREAGEHPDMPELAPELTYLLETLMEAGPTSTAGMGPVPLTWADLAAWEWGTGIELQPWESRLLRVLSAEYLVQSQAAEKFGCPRPWLGPTDTDQRAKVAQHIQSVLRG